MQTPLAVGMQKQSAELARTSAAITSKHMSRRQQYFPSNDHILETVGLCSCLQYNRRVWRLHVAISSRHNQENGLHDSGKYQPIIKSIESQSQKVHIRTTRDPVPKLVRAIGTRAPPQAIRHRPLCLATKRSHKCHPLSRTQRGEPGVGPCSIESSALKAAPKLQGSQGQHRRAGCFEKDERQGRLRRPRKRSLRCLSH